MPGYAIKRQREAVAFHFGWDVRDEDLSEYQYGRHQVRGVKLWNAGDGYAVAVRAGKKFPPEFSDYAPWTKHENVPGWDVYTSDGGALA